MSTSTTVEVVNRGSLAVRIGVALTCVCTVFVGLRLWARKSKSIRIAADDYNILASLLLQYGLLAILIIAVQNGLGQTITAVSDQQVQSVLKCLIATVIVYGTNLLTIKVAILLMYHTIFPTHYFRTAAVIISGVTFVWWICTVFIAIFQCHPIPLAWDKSLEGHCLNEGKFFVGNTVPNIVTDIVILALPAREVWNLQISRSQKFAVSGIFMMGGLIVIVSVIRLVSLVNLSEEGSDRDTTYILALPWIWTIVEPSIAIISACLPTLRPLVRECFGRTPHATKIANNTSITTPKGPHTWTLEKVKGDDGTGSFERLNEPDNGEIGCLTPEGYEAERKSTVQGGCPNARNEAMRLEEESGYPMHTIMVKKDVVIDWKETA